MSRARCGSAIASTTCRMRRAWAISTRAGRTAPTRAAIPITTTSMRGTRRPTASASSINAAPSFGCSIRPPIASERLDIAFLRIAHRQRGSSFRLPITSTAFHVHPAGHSVALDARGELFTFPLWEGAVRQHGEADGVPLSARPMAGRRHHARRGQRRIRRGAASRYLPKVGAAYVPWDVGRVIALRAAPRGRQVALANHRNEVMIGDLDTGTLTVDRSQRRRSHRGSRVVA